MSFNKQYRFFGKILSFSKREKSVVLRHKRHFNDKDKFLLKRQKKNLKSFQSQHREENRESSKNSAMAYFAARRTIASATARATLASSPRFRVAAAIFGRLPASPVRAPTRSNTTGPGYSPLNDPSPSWSNRPPKETILLDGCDYEHWLIVMEFPDDPKPSEDDMVASYVKTLASVLGR